MKCNFGYGLLTLVEKLTQKPADLITHNKVNDLEDFAFLLRFKAIGVQGGY
jgi:hypothetical protein